MKALVLNLLQYGCKIAIPYTCGCIEYGMSCFESCEGFKRAKGISVVIGRGIPCFSYIVTGSIDEIRSKIKAKPNARQWKKIHQKYLKFNPSEEEYKLFLVLNS